MKKPLLIFFILFLFLINLLFCGCINNDNTSSNQNNDEPLSDHDKLVGTWESEEDEIGYMIFYENYTGKIISELFESEMFYSIENGTIIVSAEHQDTGEIVDAYYDYLFYGDGMMRLRLEGRSFIFKKVD